MKGRISNDFYLCVDDISISCPASCNSNGYKRGAQASSAPLAKLGELTNSLTLAAPAVLTLTARPNPTKTEFILEGSTKQGAAVSIRTVDMTGRTLHVFSEANGNFTIRFGRELGKSNYYAEVVQGME